MTNYQSKKLSVHPQLAEHSHEFRKELIEVVAGVHVAVGYGLANSILIEGEEEVIIVDTLGSRESAEILAADFDAIRAGRPVAAIILTHNHADHVLGAGVFAGENTRIIAHETTQQYLERYVGILNRVIGRRSARQFGTLLPDQWLENAGIGPYLDAGVGRTPAIRWPTETVSDRWQGEIAGIPLEIIHTPGETNDALSIWLPEQRTMISADNLYRTFPNLYAIRGTPHRDVMQWVHSLDKVRAYQPDYLIPCHTRPLIGQELIEQTLTDYRDAIQYLHDQTVRWMNQGLTPDEIVERVRLPKHLADSPFLREHYGTVAWSVRAIFDGYLGFFSGEARDLHPLAPAEKATQMINLAGGADQMRQAARNALADGNAQWALELADHLLRADWQDEVAQQIRIDALIKLGEAHISANGRNYYLTQALESIQANSAGLEPTRPSQSQVVLIPLRLIFAQLPVSLDPTKCGDLVQSCAFTFPDTGEAYTVYVRRGVAEVHPIADAEADIRVAVDGNLWKGIVTGHDNPVTAIMQGKLRIEGDPLAFGQFMGLFRARLNPLQWRILHAFCETVTEQNVSAAVARQLMRLPEPMQSGAISLLQQLDAMGFTTADVATRQQLLDNVGKMNPKALVVIEALKQVAIQINI
ncbi:MAG: alkyl sulfatase dimerization domain-containing protein [Chloroflexota bacterium]